MKNIIGAKDKLKGMVGRVRVCGFEAGVIAYLMSERALTLREAMVEAERLGAMRSELHTHNLETTAGRQFVGRRISGEESVGLAYLALGTGITTPVMSDTQLGSETIRKVLTECYQGDVYVYSSVFFLASECSFNIQEAGIFGGAAASAAANSGSMLCRFLIGNNNTVNQYDLTIQHTAEV